MTPSVPNSTFSVRQVDALDAAFGATVLGALLYPVGCIYFSTNSTNPATSLGFGTWSAFGAGRVPVGFSSGETEFDTDEETGGEKTHTLLTAEMPSHDHNLTTYGSDTGSGAVGLLRSVVAVGDVSTTADTIAEAGSDTAHNNLQPYIVVRMWKRLT